MLHQLRVVVRYSLPPISNLAILEMAGEAERVQIFVRVGMKI